MVYRPVNHCELKGGKALVHGAAFPILSDLAKGITTKKEAIDKSQRYSHCPKIMKFLF